MAVLPKFSPANLLSSPSGTHIVRLPFSSIKCAKLLSVFLFLAPVVLLFIFFFGFVVFCKFNKNPSTRFSIPRAALCSFSLSCVLFALSSFFSGTSWSVLAFSSLRSRRGGGSLVSLASAVSWLPGSPPGPPLQRRATCVAHQASRSFRRRHRLALCFSSHAGHR